MPLREVFGGHEPTHMTPAIAAEVSVLDRPLGCFFSEDGSQVEVNALGRSLDILASAALPTGDDVQVAIENQYDTADPSHFGRLVGWYMSETGAEMGVLIAEDFDPHLVRTVQEGRIVRPEHGLFLVQADGYMLDNGPVVHYTTVACSLDRPDWLRRQQSYQKRLTSAATASTGSGIADLAARVFAHIEASTTATWLKAAFRSSPTTTGQYRWIRDNGDTCHLVLCVAQHRISVGSCYLKAGHSDETVAALEDARLTETEPPPARVYLRGAWWDILERGYLSDALPDDLGDLVAARVEALRPALDRHQTALLEAAKSSGGV